VIIVGGVNDSRNGAGDTGQEAEKDKAPASGSAEAPAAEAPDPLEEAKQETARMKDQLLRTAADFDNFRKRTRREAVEAERKGREDLLRDLLPVFDNLERATSHTDKATDVQSVAEGIRMVIRQFEDTLSKLGIERIATVGKAFDPSVHEAIQQMETNDHPAGTVAAEIQGGYRTSERLIRPALVVVAKPPAG